MAGPGPGSRSRQTGPGSAATPVSGWLVLPPCADVIGSANMAFAPSQKYKLPPAGRLCSPPPDLCQGLAPDPGRCGLGWPAWEEAHRTQTPGHPGRGSGEPSWASGCGGQWLVSGTADPRNLLSCALQKILPSVTQARKYQLPSTMGPPQGYSALPVSVWASSSLSVLAGLNSAWFQRPAPRLAHCSACGTGKARHSMPQGRSKGNSVFLFCEWSWLATTV